MAILIFFDNFYTEPPHARLHTAKHIRKSADVKKNDPKRHTGPGATHRPSIFPGGAADCDLEDDVDTANPSYQSHQVKSMERGGFNSRVCSVLVVVKQRELHGHLEELIQLPG
ncbi:unnamed protein product [Gadus morhua 'NCC']